MFNYFIVGLVALGIGYVTGNHNGHKQGYEEAKSVYLPKYEEAVIRLNTYITQSNVRQQQLQDSALQATKQAQEWKSRYEEQVSCTVKLPEKEATQTAFTPSMVSAINGLLK